MNALEPTINEIIFRVVYIYYRSKALVIVYYDVLNLCIKVKRSIKNLT